MLGVDIYVSSRSYTVLWCIICTIVGHLVKVAHTNNFVSFLLPK